MISDPIFEKLSLDELLDLLVEKTTEYMELTGQKNVDGPKLRNLKLELDKLHLIIAHKKAFS